MKNKNKTTKAKLIKKKLQNYKSKTDKEKINYKPTKAKLIRKK